MNGRPAHPAVRLEALVLPAGLALVALIGVAAASSSFSATKVVLFGGAGVAAILAMRSLPASLTLLLLVACFPFGSKVLTGIDVRVTNAVLAVVALQLFAAVYFHVLRVPREVWVPLAVAAFGALVASVAGPDPGRGVLLLAIELVPVFAAAVAAATALDARRDLPRLVLVVAGALCGTGLLAIYQKAGGALPFGPDFGTTRIAGLFNHPNILGGFTAAAMLLLVGVAAHGWQRVPLAPLVLGVPILLGLPTLAFTLSRGALLGLAVGLVVIFLLTVARRRIAPLLTFLLMAVVVFVVVLPQVPDSQVMLFTQRVTAASQAGGDEGRGLIFAQAVTVFEQYAATGVGPLVFGKVMDTSPYAAGFQGGAIHSHNLYLETALSLGPLGFLALAWFVGGAVWRLLRVRRRAGGAEDPLAVGWAIGSLAALAAIAVHGFVDFVFWQIETLTFLFLLLGIAYAVARTAGDPAPGALDRAADEGMLVSGRTGS